MINEREITTNRKNGYASDFNFAKGVGMLLIIIAHSIYNYSYSNLFMMSLYAIIIYGIMPMFFIINGIGYKHRPFKSKLKQKVKFMLKPYIYVTLIITFLFPLFHFAVFHYWKNAFKEMLKVVLAFVLGISYHTGFSVGGLELYDCGSMWFILTLFNASIVLNLITAIKKVWIQRLLTFTCVVLGWIASILDIYFFCIPTSLITVGYLYVGMILRQTKVLEKKIKWYIYLFLGMIWVIGVVFGKVNMANNIWKLGVLDIIFTGVAGFLLIKIFSLVNCLNGIIMDKIRKIGFYSLYVLCIHTIESICIPWYLFADAFSQHPLIGIALQCVLRGVLIFTICYIIRIRKKIMNQIRKVLKLPLVQQILTLICILFISFFISTRIAAFFLSWRAISISRIFVWGGAVVFCVLLFFVKRFAVNYMAERATCNGMCVLVCSGIAFLFNVIVTTKFRDLGIVIAYEGMLLIEKVFCLLGASILLSILLTQILNVFQGICKNLIKKIKPEKKDVLFWGITIMILFVLFFAYFS